MIIITNSFLIESRYPSTSEYIDSVVKATQILKEYDSDFFKHIYPPDSKIPMKFDENTFDFMMKYYVKNYSKVIKEMDGEILTAETKSNHLMMGFQNTTERRKVPFSMKISSGCNMKCTFGPYLNMQFREKIDYVWQQNLLKWMIAKLSLKCAYSNNFFISKKFVEYVESNNITEEQRIGLASAGWFGFLNYFSHHFDFSDAPSYAEVEPFGEGNFIHITNREIMDVENPEHMKNYIDFNYYMLKKGFRSDKKFDLS